MSIIRLLSQVPGRIRMRGDRLASLQSLNDTRENQYMPGQRRDVTFVTRLQSVQAAVDQQLGDMAKQHPDRRLALITFSTEVSTGGLGPVSLRFRSSFPQYISYHFKS
jgi:hypothetical protein